MPLCVMLSNASGGNSGKSGLNTAAIPDSNTRVGITAATRCRDMRLASVRARNLLSANWKALKPATTSNELSGHGSASRSPVRKSPSGVGASRRWR